jgi:hypothetical protein
MDKRGFASLRLQDGAHDEMLVRLGSGRWPAKLRRARAAIAYFDSTGRHAKALSLVSFNMPTWTPGGSEPDAQATPACVAQAAQVPVAPESVAHGPSGAENAGGGQNPVRQDPGQRTD